MSFEPAIRVARLAKSYRVFQQPSDRLKQALWHRIVALRASLTGEPVSPAALHRYGTEVLALSDVSFEVGRGETVGILGRNGAGKSTLLQMVAGLLEPSAGSVEVRGRVAALLELGSGFNPEFTGVENVRFNGAILGLTPGEIEQRMQAILDFADIGEFAHRPLKTYSTGMAVRLAFAVQAQIEPEVLIVDEALAVGDAKFQAKCFARLKELKQRGTSILFVTHSTEQVVSHCDRALLIERGSLLMDGEPRAVVNRYLTLLFGTPRAEAATGGAAPAAAAGPRQPDARTELYASRSNYNPYEHRWGDGAAKILDFALESEGREYPQSISAGSEVRLAVAVRFQRPVARPIFGLTIKTKEGVTVYGTNSEMNPAPAAPTLGQPGTACVVEFRLVCRLGPGDYFVSVGVASRDGVEVVPHDRRYDSIHLHVVGAGYFGLADLGVSLSLEDVRQ